MTICDETEPANRLALLRIMKLILLLLMQGAAVLLV